MSWLEVLSLTGWVSGELILSVLTWRLFLIRGLSSSNIFIDRKECLNSTVELSHFPPPALWTAVWRQRNLLLSTCSMRFAQSIWRWHQSSSIKKKLSSCKRLINSLRNSMKITLSKTFPQLNKALLLSHFSTNKTLSPNLRGVGFFCEKANPIHQSEGRRAVWLKLWENFKKNVHKRPTQWYLVWQMITEG